MGVTGQRVQNPTNLSPAALQTQPPLQNTREQETNVTNQGPAVDNEGVAVGHDKIREVIPDAGVSPDITAAEIKRLLLEAQKGGQQFGQASQLPPPEVPA